MTASLDLATDADTVPDVILALTFGEFATALCFSPMPATGRHTAEQVIGWVLDGIDRAGGVAAVRRIDQEILAALRYGDFDGVNDRHFPLGERRRRAGDLADDLTRWLTGRGPARPGVMPR
ncbi:hypothetical protein AB0K60_07160 [Thermopolyspora sp. NPDC052614]|uniref:hypothetical protein n=1 Tax=Thermopolyspora sp. NPDC052614 TaxID=3155682 RepID=UPI00342B8870